MSLKGKRILITGGSGFLGRVVVKRLEETGAHVFVCRSKHYDLVDYKACGRLFRYVNPNIVVHLAAYYGGIDINRKYPAKIYFRNLIMGANVIEQCRRWDVEKFVGIGTACSYPGYLEGDLKEENLWDGPCHESVRNYGATKKMLQIQCEAYKKQYGLDGIHLILTNLYGEWDSYNPERSHVVAALIRKFVEAKMNNGAAVEVWGNGVPIREFIYVGDVAKAIAIATDVYNDLSPLNIGTGIGTSILELVNMIQTIIGYKGTIFWNTKMPSGQSKKILDIKKMKKVLNWESKTSLQDGLKKTISWFENNYQEAIKRW